MHNKYLPQISLFEHYSNHELGRQLKSISEQLDRHPEILDLVFSSILPEGTKQTGRCGLSIDSIVRAALLKQMMSLSYEELSFYINDSISYQSFVRTTINPTKSALQSNISLIDAGVWEAINRILLLDCNQTGIEKGRTVRIDSTVTESHIHPPTDSSLLWDCVRTLVRVLKKIQDATSTGTICFVDHSRSAKKAAWDIEFSRKTKKNKLYHKLLGLIHQTLNAAKNVVEQPLSNNCSFVYQSLVSELQQWIAMSEKVISQTQRRVFNGEKVPHAEKVFSIFESHTDIIIKGSRDIQFGHKLNITTGRSGLVLDIVVEDGNPADSAQLCPMIERQKQVYGRVPRQTAADGGYASQENLKKAKEMGVKDVAFNKKRGLKIEEMAKSTWVYKRLTKFRAGIEGNISCLKRRYGLGRCIWKGLEHFKSYVWSSTVAYNLILLAKLSSG